MGVADDATPIHHEDRRRADQEELLDLEVQGCDFGAFIGQDGVRRVEFVNMSLDHFGTVGYHHPDVSVKGFEFLVVMTQLRHMVGAVWSGKADIEHQQKVVLFICFG